MVLATQENCDTTLTAYDIDIICGVSIYIIKNLALFFKGKWDIQLGTVHGNKIAAMQ